MCDATPICCSLVCLPLSYESGFIEVEKARVALNLGSGRDGAG